MTDQQIAKFVSENLDEIMELVEEDTNQGLCVNCGALADYVEPDAREYTCDECEKPAVYGATELLLYS